MDENEKAQAQREAWAEGFRANSAAKDKIVVTISGAALGLSIAFLANIEPNTDWKPVLGLALAAFGAAVVLVLASLDLNSRQIKRGIEHLDARTDGPDGFPREVGPIDGSYKVGRYRVTDVLNSWSVFSTIAGIVLIVVFVWKNL